MPWLQVAPENFYIPVLYGFLKTTTKNQIEEYFAKLNSFKSFFELFDQFLSNNNNNNDIFGQGWHKKCVVLNRIIKLTYCNIALPSYTTFCIVIFFSHFHLSANQTRMKLNWGVTTRPRKLSHEVRSSKKWCQIRCQFFIEQFSCCNGSDFSLSACPFSWNAYSKVFRMTKHTFIY